MTRKNIGIEFATLENVLKICIDLECYYLNDGVNLGPFVKAATLKCSEKEWYFLLAPTLVVLPRREKLS